MGLFCWSAIIDVLCCWHKRSVTPEIFINLCGRSCVSIAVVDALFPIGIPIGILAHRATGFCCMAWMSVFFFLDTRSLTRFHLCPLGLAGTVGISPISFRNNAMLSAVVPSAECRVDCITVAAAAKGEGPFRKVGAPMTRRRTMGEDVTKGACVEGANLTLRKGLAWGLPWWFPGARKWAWPGGRTSTERRRTSWGEGAPVTLRRPPAGAPDTRLRLLVNWSAAVVAVFGAATVW